MLQIVPSLIPESEPMIIFNSKSFLEILQNLRGLIHPKSGK